MKTILNRVLSLRRVIALGAMLAFVPLTSGLHPAEAKPPRHAPAHGYRAKRQAPRGNVRRYPARTYRRTRADRTPSRYDRYDRNDRNNRYDRRDRDDRSPRRRDDRRRY